MVSLYAGLRASGNGSAWTMRPARMSTRSKSAKVIIRRDYISRVKLDHLRGYIACVVQVDGPRSSARRVLGVAVQTLAWRFLSGGAAAGALVRTLCAHVRHCGDQQQFLPSARTRDVRVMGTPRAAALRIRSEGQPLPDTHEEAEGSRGADRPALQPHARARHPPRTGVVSTAAGMESGCRAVPSFSANAAQGDQARGRVS